MNIEEARRRATITVAEAGLLLGIGRSSAYEAVRRGEIPAVRLVGRIVVPVAPLLRLLGVEGAAGSSPLPELTVPNNSEKGSTNGT